MRERRQHVDVTFDGVEYEAYADETILQAANRLGVNIPSLCYLGAKHQHVGQSDMGQSKSFVSFESLFESLLRAEILGQQKI